MIWERHKMLAMFFHSLQRHTPQGSKTSQIFNFGPSAGAKLHRSKEGDRYKFWRETRSPFAIVGFKAAQERTGEWWAREDSNLQPDRYERSALTIELRAQRVARGAAAALEHFAPKRNSAGISLSLPPESVAAAAAPARCSPAPATWLTGCHTLPAPFRRSPDEPM
jgi:hypothetical protein